MDADDHRGGWSTTDATPALHCMQNSVALQRHGGRISETCLKKKGYQNDWAFSGLSRTWNTCFLSRFLGYHTFKCDLQMEPNQQSYTNGVLVNLCRQSFLFNYFLNFINSEFPLALTQKGTIR
ncbi:Uncharacterized protein APZ42_023890 [Daphnia magna]|uniref:Uncharacterized protein n=1 Tax=Daphnia magna TaxID=35525 RepID=A0A164U965_9CRUS|nr:Uncharacterized protein APZ42_023890 [Daphnia magna]